MPAGSGERKVDDVCFEDIDEKKLHELAGRLADGSVEKAVATQLQFGV